jgi:hypothetical protein
MASKGKGPQDPYDRYAVGDDDDELDPTMMRILALAKERRKAEKRLLLAKEAGDVDAIKLFKYDARDARVAHIAALEAAGLRSGPVRVEDHTDGVS